MKRNIPPKKKSVPTCFEEIRYNFGGYTAFPPDDCPARTVQRGPDDVLWVDNMSCVHCERKISCVPYKTHRKAVMRHLKGT